jgi:hypothetical protein
MRVSTSGFEELFAGFCSDKLSNKLSNKLVEVAVQVDMWNCRPKGLWRVMAAADGACMKLEFRHWSRLLRSLGVAAVCLVGAMTAGQAHASMALLLEQPYGGLGAVNPTGHSAIYLDHVCAASPLELRACKPGELGVVISRYDGIEGYDWLAVPLLPYVYAVESPVEIPETMDKEREIALRDQYRRRHLEAFAPDLPDGGMPGGNWYELVGSAYDRTIYGFSMKTTPEQDAALIAIFNDQRNVEHYNGAFRNCADFARVTINRIYPHAIRRNFVADFGLTTPKSVARALAHYAKKHPRMELHVFVIPQVQGTLPRSHAAEGVTESLLKRYGVPLVVLSPMATAAVFVAYLGHGRFDVPHNAPVLDLRDAEVDLALAGETTEGEDHAPPSILLPAPSLQAPGDGDLTRPVTPGLGAPAATPGTMMPASLQAPLQTTVGNPSAATE